MHTDRSVEDSEELEELEMRRESRSLRRLNMGGESYSLEYSAASPSVSSSNDCSCAADDGDVDGGDVDEDDDGDVDADDDGDVDEDDDGDVEDGAAAVGAASALVRVWFKQFLHLHARVQRSPARRHSQYILMHLRLCG